MPGPVKNNLASKVFFTNGCELVQKLFSPFFLKQEVHPRLVTGPVLIVALSGNPDKMKSIAVKIENSRAWTRMLDIDIYIKGSKESIHRKTGRLCFVCDNPSVLCSRSQAHGTIEIKRAIEAMFHDLNNL